MGDKDGGPRSKRLCQEVTLSGLSVILQPLLALGASVMLSTLPGFTSSVLSVPLGKEETVPVSQMEKQA